MNNYERIERLLGLYSKFNLNECKVLDLYLNAFYSDYSRGGSEYEEIISLVKNDPESLLTEITFNGKSEDAIRKTIERTIEKSIESLTLPVNVMRKDELEPVDRDYLRTLWYTQASKRLLLKGLLDIAVVYIRKAIKIAKRIEQFDLALMNLYQLSSICTFRSRKIKSIDFELELNELEKSRADFYASQRLREEMFGLYNTDKPSSRDLEGLGKMYEKSLRLSHSKDGSTLRNVYYSQLLYFDKLSDYEECYNVCLTLSGVIEGYYAVNKERELQATYANLSQFSILRKDFEKALKDTSHLLKSTKLSQNSHNFLAISKSRILLYLNKPERADNFISKYLNESETSSIARYQLNIIHAVSKIQVKKFSDAANLLYNLGELKRDKAGWNFFARYYLILTYGLNGQVDVAINEFENFVRYLHGKELSTRQKDLVKALRFIVNGEEFSGSIDGDWDPTSSEVVDSAQLLNIRNEQ